MSRVLATALALPVLALGFAASPALADPRLVQVMYNESEVVRIEGKLSVQASIIFGDDELIENVAIGDSASWQVTPNKRANILFVKPLDARASTNMTVVTSKRTYLFELVASPSAKPLYVLRFDYPPAPPEAAGDLQLAQGPNAVEQAAITDPQAVTDPAALNFAWDGSGDRKLLPARTYDDGTMTYLSWPAGREVPAILIKDSQGVEGPVNFSVKGDTIVVDGVPALIVLRAGKDSAELVKTGGNSAQTTRGDAALASRETN